MDSSPLLQLIRHGQSYWLDNLTRNKITSGELERRAREEGLRGITSNPTIFHKAITGSHDYDEQIRAAFAAGKSAPEVYEEVVVSDVRDACDVLHPVYEQTGGADGFVSLEVSPHLAHDSQATIEEARRLHDAVDRPNLFIKIPGTLAGVPAIEQCLFEGININITLLFSVPRYEAVAEAYLRALERRIEAGEPVRDIASVASFFLSRIDTLVDQLLAHRFGTSHDALARQLLGKVAIANAKLAYESFKRIVGGDRWRALEAKGARVQRVGQHQHQELRLQGCDVRRASDRPSYRQHHARRDHRGLRGSRQSRSDPGGGSGRCATGHGFARCTGHQLCPGRRPAGERGRTEVHRAL
jgi:transaldolase